MLIVFTESNYVNTTSGWTPAEEIKRENRPGEDRNCGEESPFAASDDLLAERAHTHARAGYATLALMCGCKHRAMTRPRQGSYCSR